MSLVDLNPQFVLISLLLKSIFLVIVSAELILPRLKHDTLHMSWKTDWETELQNAVVEGGAFLFSIGMLLIFDILASGDSWIPFPLTVTLDLLLVLLILILLFCPKLYGITDTGIFHQGLILQWEKIINLEEIHKGLKIRTRGFFRESTIIPLPRNELERIRIVETIQEKVQSGKGNSSSD